MKTNQELKKFIKYLNQTLIPDLDASNMPATANDFETAEMFCRQYLRLLERLDELTKPAKP